MKNIKKYFVVIMTRKRIGIDKYYREKEEDANSILNALEDLYPNAEFKFETQEIIVKEND